MVAVATPKGALLDQPYIDPAWAQSVLIDSGAAKPGSRLQDVRFDEFIGTGQLGRSARFQLDWADHDDQPTSFVAKIPGMQPELTAVLFDTGMYDAEIAFYNHVAPLVDVVRPRCYHAFGSREDLLFVIMMEDLADYRAGDQLKGVGIDDIHRAVEQAAALHGPHWGDPALAQLDFFARRDPNAGKFTADCYQQYLPEVIERLGDGLSDEAIETIERFGGVIHRLVGARGTSPTTVVHGDFRPDNLLLSPGNPQRPMVVVDWQTMTLAPGPNDIAYLLGGALAPTERQAIEDGVLGDYLGYLHQRYGLTDYTEADMRRDYTFGTLSGLIVAVTATIRAIRTERGDELFTLMIERHAAHAREHGAIDLVASAL